MKPFHLPDWWPWLTSSFDLGRVLAEGGCGWPGFIGPMDARPLLDMRASTEAA